MLRPCLYNAFRRSSPRKTRNRSPKPRKMPSLRTFRIEFNRTNATYSPGELVTGNVIIDLAREKTVRALKLLIKGEAEVDWKKTRTRKDTQGRNHTHTDHYRANEQYLNLTYSLVEDRGEEFRMLAERRIYSFEFLLPYHIPCSFEHKNGHIRYTAKAIIDRPWRFNHECKTAFTVVTPYDLNAHSQQCLGIDDEVSENFYRCWCSLGSIKMRIKLPTTGFVPGQLINTTINLENTSRINVARISFKLERYLEFHATMPYTTTKKDKTVVTTEQSVGSIGQITDIMSQLQIPPIPPSQLEYCNIIDQKYAIHVTLHISGMHFNVSKTYPILIGTIPLRPTIPSATTVGSARHQHLQDTVQPTAPAIDYDPPPPMPPDYASNMSYPSTWPVGFASLDQPSTSTDQWDMPPPSYEECMQKAVSIKDHEDSNYVHGANESFAPRYPVFTFPTPNPPGK